MPFLSRNFDNFVELMKQKISQANEWATPDSKVAYYLNLLAEGRRVTLTEIIEVDKYVQQVMGRLRTAADRIPAGAGVGRMQPPLDTPRPSEMRPLSGGAGLLGMGSRPALQPAPRQGERSSPSIFFFLSFDHGKVTYHNIVYLMILYTLDQQFWFWTIHLSLLSLSVISWFV